MERIVLTAYPSTAFLYLDSAGDFDPEARFFLSTYDGKWEGEMWTPDFTEDQMQPSESRTFRNWQDVIMYCKSLALWFGVELIIEEYA